MTSKSGGTSQIVGYRYVMAVQYGLCRAPVNEVTEIRAGGLLLDDTVSSASTSYAVDKPDLFGGDTKEGGIVGVVDICMGEATQIPSPIITDNMEGGFDVPGWRGVLTVFYYGQIGSNNPYPKQWKFRVNRQTAGWDNDDPWYPDTALITLSSNTQVVMTFDSNPADGDTITIGSDTITFVNASAGPTEVLIGADATATATNFANFLNFNTATYDNVVALANGLQIDMIFATIPIVAEGIGDFSSIAIQGGTIRAMNPAHIIYECATNNVWGRGLPTALIDDAAFRAAANTLYTEKFGLCLRWNREDDIDKFVAVVAEHIGCAVYIDRTTGLLTIRLIRDDYDPATLTTYDFTNGLIDIEDDESASSDTLFNEVIVKFVDPITGKQGQVREQNLASFQALGTLISTTNVYTGCPTASLAHRLAMRDLQLNSGELRRLKLKFNRGGLYINPGDVFKISAPSRGIESMVVRAGGIEDATLTDGTISISVLQDVFSLPLTTYKTPQPSFWVPPPITPRVVSKRDITEMTYFDLAENTPPSVLAAITSDTGILKIYAANPGGGAVDYVVDTEAAGESAFVERNIAGFDESAVLTAAIGPYDVAAYFTPESSLTTVVVGQPIRIDDEYCRVDSIDIPGGVMGIARGCIDTIPTPHAAGARIWFQTNAPTSDFRDYATSEDVYVKLLTRTTSAKLSETAAPTDTITIEGRQGRPYPPGYMQVGGIWALNTGITIAGDVTFTWAHRDRIVEGNFLLDTLGSSTGPEAGTTYNIRVYDGSDATPTTLLRTVTGISTDTWTYDTAMSVADGDLNVYWFQIEAERAGLLSWQHYDIRVYRFYGSGALVAGSSTMSGAGSAGSSGSGGGLGSGGSTGGGTGTSGSTGTGALIAGLSTMSGSGSGAVLGTSGLAAGSGTIAGAGVSGSVGTGALLTGSSTMAGAGSAPGVSSGSGALVAGSSIVAGAGDYIAWPTYVNFGTPATVLPGTSFIIPLPASRTVGNVMIAATTIGSARVPTWSAGWTPIGAGFAAYRVVTGTESAGPTVSWTGSSNQGGVIFQYKDAAGGVGATRDNQAQTGTTATVASITTTAARSLCVAVVIEGTNFPRPTLPSGYTLDTSSAAGSTFSWTVGSDQEATSGASCPAVSSTVVNGVWRALLIELKS